MCRCVPKRVLNPVRPLPTESCNHVAQDDSFFWMMHMHGARSKLQAADVANSLRE